jgi:hypothetical protein
VGKQINRVLHDVPLGLEIRENVDRGVSNEERLRMCGDVHDEDVTDAARGAQACCRGGHRAHQLVSMQAALH